jgi:tetratricopeptide (TPR) repeat protein
VNQSWLYTVVVSCILTPFLFGQTDSSGDQLQQLITQLQQSPNDQALREKIIALALTMNPKPPTPIAATQAEGAAEYAFVHAQNNADYSDAAKQYEKALLLAPWLAADYFNCGVAQEKAGELKEAILSFNLYLLAAPNADDAQAVNKRIGGLQYAMQKAKAQTEEAAKKEAEIHIGSHYGGGIVFYVDGTGHHGLIAATTDLATVKKDAINWYQAVQLCRDYRGGGYSDWFMPSKDQLNILYQQKNIVGGFGDWSYWSSTEAGGGVWLQNFDDGDQFGPKGKNNTNLNLRAIRAF